MNLSQPENIYDFTLLFLNEVGKRSIDEQELLIETMFAAAEFHGNQRRKGGKLYMVHPLQVAIILMQHQADKATVAASLLHDVLEDTNIPEAEIEKRFNLEILQMVKILSKNLFSHEEVIAASRKDPRIANIKIADRLSNTLYGSMLHLAKERHLFNLEETESFHFAELATIPGVNPELVHLLEEAQADSWNHYNSRTD